VNGLNEKVIVVTGAGRGLGAATVHRLAIMGARVVAGDIRKDWIDEVCADARSEAVQARGGSAASDVVGVEVDVADEASVDRLFDTAAEHFGPLYGLVNAAAVLRAVRLEDLELAEWERTMRVNATGVFLCCRRAVRDFRRNGAGGAIVNVGSISAVVGLSDQPAYCASKGAVLQLSRQIAADYAPDGVRCNVVGPGSIAGEFLDNYLRGQADPEAAKTNILSAHPVARFASPDEIVAPIVFLLSEEASFITGANLQADGGYTAI
jgi:NAD(P)-dependent dehydrogenase (short-subunit alcohol dehydrogenase family)